MSLCECHMLAWLAQSGKGELAMNANAVRGMVTDVAKGQSLTHISFHWGTETHTLLLLFETPPSVHMTLSLLTAGIYILE